LYRRPYHFSIDKLCDEFINYERSTKDQSKDSNYYRDYYLNEKGRREISSEAMSIINDSVDKELMSHFGYKVLSWRSELIKDVSPRINPLTKLRSYNH